MVRTLKSLNISSRVSDSSHGGDKALSNTVLLDPRVGQTHVFSCTLMIHALFCMHIILQHFFNQEKMGKYALMLVWGEEVRFERFQQ